MPAFASPATASPAMTATASGRKTGKQIVSAANARNNPLPVIWPMNAGPPSPGRGADSFTAVPMSAGIAARTTSIAMLRRRRKTSRTSLMYCRRSTPR